MTVEAIITTGNGTLTIELDNYTLHVGNDAQCITNFTFTTAGRLPTPTALSTISGLEVNINSSGKVTSTNQITSAPPSQSLHWSESTTGHQVFLTTVDGSFGHTPTHIIMGPANSPGQYFPAPNPSVSNHQPLFGNSGTAHGSAIFVLSDPGVTANTVLTASMFMNMTFGFGTTLGVDLSGSQIVPFNPIPEPSSLVLLGLGMAGLVGYRVHRRRSIPRQA